MPNMPKNLTPVVYQNHAVIELVKIGKILNYNTIFLKFMGYQLQDLTDKAHTSFLNTTQVDSAEYQAAWHNLSQGELGACELKFLYKLAK